MQEIFKALGIIVQLEFEEWTYNFFKNVLISEINQTNDQSYGKK